MFSGYLVRASIPLTLFSGPQTDNVHGSKPHSTPEWMEPVVFQDGDGSSFSTESSPFPWLYGVSSPSIPPTQSLPNIAGVPGYYALPDLPSNTRVRWLNSEEKALALDRMKRAGKQLEEPVTVHGLKRVLGKWHFWVYTAYYT